MSSRESILRRLRDVRIPGVTAPPTLPCDAELFADGVRADDQDVDKDVDKPLVDLFAERFTKLNGELHHAPDERSVPDILSAILDSAGSGPAVVHADPWLDAFLSAAPELAARFSGTSTDAPAEVFAEYVAGVSTVDALIARTGSLLVTTTTTGGRRLSVLPPLHVAVARRSQVVPSLDAALAAVAARKDDGWSSLSIVTGPSCTADIEKILVRGAHGPKRLAVVLVEG